MTSRFRDIARRLRQAPSISRRDVVLVVILPLVWAGIERSIRPRITELRCHERPETCQVESLLPIDRVAVANRSKEAAFLSNVTQNSSGVIAALVPLALHLGRVASGAVSAPAAMAAYGADLVMILQGIFVNGTFNGIVRCVVQRPRPGVYRQPHGNGRSESQYTSFYSGHTSFATVTMASLVFILLGRVRSRLWPGLAAALGVGLVAATGWLRVAAGWHFPTDVLVAPIPGLLIALGVALAHRPPSRV